MQSAKYSCDTCILSSRLHSVTKLQQMSGKLALIQTAYTSSGNVAVRLIQHRIYLMTESQ